VEKTLWYYLKKGMGQRWNACRHEDRSTPGTPDVSFGISRGLQGWMELKAIDDWPRRDSTIVRIRHLTRVQKLWLTRRGETGASCWILVRVKRDYLLFHWTNIDRLGEMTRSEMYDAATRVYTGSIDWRDFLQAIAYVENRRLQ